MKNSRKENTKTFTLICWQCCANCWGLVWIFIQNYYFEPFPLFYFVTMALLGRLDGNESFNKEGNSKNTQVLKREGAKALDPGATTK